MRGVIAAGAALIIGACAPEADAPAESVQSETAYPAMAAEPAPAPASTTPAGANDYSVEQLRAAIGAECPKAVSSEFKGEASGRRFYAVECQRGDFLVGVDEAGESDVLPCEAAKSFGLSCWGAWK